MSATNRTILLVGEHAEYRHEGIVGTAFKPGYALEMTSAAAKTFQPHSTRGGKGRKLFALENSYLGGTIEGLLADGATTYYGTADPNCPRAFVHEAQPGDKINTVLKSGESVTKGDYLISYGDGHMAKAATALLYQILADSATLTSWTTEVAFSNGTATAIPANTLKVGDRIRIRATVAVPSSNSTDTLTIRLFIGSTVLLTTGAVNITNDDVGRLDYVLTIRTIGASGTMVGAGAAVLGVAGTAVPSAQQLASTAIDTTAAQTIAVKAAASVSNAGNQAILREFTVERLAASDQGSGSAGGVVWGQADETVDASAADKFCAMTVMA